jgi:hypothetical protein
MPGVSRDNDTASGDLIPSQSTVFANNEEVIIDGDAVEGHGSGAHAAPTIPASQNPSVYVENKLAVVQGDPATCNHTSTGSGDVYIYDLAAVVAQAIGAPQLTISQDEAAEIIEGRAAEESVGLDPDSAESVEYGDGGISGARYDASPVTGESGPIDANSGVTDSPSPQPSNEDGQYIRWLEHVDSRVKPEVVAGLEQISQVVGYQLQVTSGYRSPEYNTRVGGAKNSQHVQGNATDIVQSGLTVEQRQAFIKAAVDAGFTAIGVYNTFTHVDIRGGALRAWGDTGSWRSLPKFPWAIEALEEKGYNYPGG